MLFATASGQHNPTGPTHNFGTGPRCLHESYGQGSSYSEPLGGRTAVEMEEKIDSCLQDLISSLNQATKRGTLQRNVQRHLFGPYAVNMILQNT